MTVLVTGGRGSIARATTAGLLAAGERVRVGGREPSALDLPDGVDGVLADLARPETLPAALDGVDRVLLYAEPSGVDGFVAAARAAGVAQIVVVSSAAVLEGPNPIGDRHRAVEDAVRASGIPAFLLRPGAFAGNARGLLGSILDGEVRMAYPDAGDAPIDERDVAGVAVAVLRAGPGAGFDDEGLWLSGPESLTRRDQVQQLADALGREARIVELDPEQARTEMVASMPPYVVDTLLRYWAAGDGVVAPVSDAVARITGRPGRTFATWAAEVAAPSVARAR